MNLTSDRAKKYFDKHPIVEIYKGYEIRSEENNSYIVDAAIAIYSRTSSDKQGCYEFIDELVSHNVHQYNDEEVSKYLINKEIENRKKKWGF